MDIISVLSLFSVIGLAVYSNKKNGEKNRKIEELNNKIISINKSLINQDKNLSLLENHIKKVTNNILTIKTNYSEVAEKIKDISIQTENTNKRIDNLSNYFSIGKSLDNKENKKYESINDHIIYDYKTISYRDFLDKHPSYKTIGLLNFDDIKNNRSVPPNFSEIATGHCSAILIENDLYSVVIKKGLELRAETIESIGISFIFELSEEPLKGFFYGQWELTKLPIFQKLNNDKWVCLSKGYLKLKPDSQEVKENIKVNNETIEQEVESFIDYLDFNDVRALSIDSISEVNNFSQKVFLTRNPNTKSLKSRKYKEKIFFNISEDGNFFSFLPKDAESPILSNFYFLFPKSEYLKQTFLINKALRQKQNSLFTKIFGSKDNNEENIDQKDASMKNIEDIFEILHDKNISAPKINKLAIIKLKKIDKEQKHSYELIEKGEIIFN